MPEGLRANSMHTALQVPWSLSTAEHSSAWPCFLLLALSPAYYAAGIPDVVNRLSSLSRGSPGLDSMGHDASIAHHKLELMDDLHLCSENPTTIEQ